MFESLHIKLALTILLGAAIGLERESREQGNGSGSDGGIRTFALVSLLGGLAGVFYSQNIPMIFWVITVVFSLLLISYYIIGSWITKATGLTSELAFFYAFLIGFLITTNIVSLQLIIAIFVVLMMILSSKSRSKKFVGGISRHELESFISYAIVALVVLPFLPNKSYTVSDIPFLFSLLEGYGVHLARFATLELLNLQRIWIVVVLVTGIDVFGYVLGKFFGKKKSFTLASFLGGFVSSTSTTQSLAQKSVHSPARDYLVGAAVLANVASFFQIFLLVGPLNGKWLVAITPTLLLLIVMGTIISVYFLSRKEHLSTREKEEHSKTIFSLVPALKFACILMLVKVVTKVCLVLFGQSGFIISSIIASFAGIDAIVVNLADMAGKTITYQFALLTFLLVNATNLLSKLVYSALQGSRPFAFRFFLSIAIMIPASFLGLVLIL